MLVSVLLDLTDYFLKVNLSEGCLFLLEVAEKNLTSQRKFKCK